MQKSNILLFTLALLSLMQFTNSIKFEGPSKLATIKNFPNYLHRHFLGLSRREVALNCMRRILMALNHNIVDPSQEESNKKVHETEDEAYLNSVQRKLNSQKKSKEMSKAPSSICADHRLYVDLKTKGEELKLIFDERCMMLASNVFECYRNGKKNLKNSLLMRKDKFNEAVQIYEAECNALGYLLSPIKSE